jgi:hypothetical protein
VAFGFSRFDGVPPPAPAQVTQTVSPIKIIYIYNERYFNMDQLSIGVSIFSLFISFAALFVAVWHNVKSFTPIITVLQNNSSLKGEISIVIQNKGIGPATLMKVEFLWGGKSIGNNFDEIIKILESRGYHLEYFFQRRSLGSVLSSGEKFTPIRFVFPDHQLPEEIIDLFNQVTVRVWYKSIYGITYRQIHDLKSG